MVNCDYCSKELNRRVFCNPSCKTMYHRKHGIPTVSQSISVGTAVSTVEKPTTSEVIITSAQQDITTKVMERALERTQEVLDAVEPPTGTVSVPKNYGSCNYCRTPAVGLFKCRIPDETEGSIDKTERLCEVHLKSVRAEMRKLGGYGQVVEV